MLKLIFQDGLGIKYNHSCEEIAEDEDFTLDVSFDLDLDKASDAQSNTCESDQRSNVSNSHSR